MADEAHEEIAVAAPPARCFDIAAGFEAYPSWAKDVKEVSVIERDADGRGTRVAYRASAIGRTISYVLDYDWSDAPSAFTWKLVEGDMLRALDGRYAFEPEGDATRVVYDLHVDLSIPLPGLVKRRAAGIIVGTALKELKRAAETA